MKNSVSGTLPAKKDSTQSPHPTTEEQWVLCWCMISLMLKHLKISPSGYATLTR